jgi:hypothetical protein
MNIVTAIVLPLDDESLIKKLRRQKNALIFTKADKWVAFYFTGRFPIKGAWSIQACGL